ncbi:MAG: ChbG/HpnK family deacetylase [Phycisphaerales bacterium]
MKSVIINADDFGLSPGVNRGILSAFRDGVVTSTTLLANMAGFDDAVAIARENPDLPVGIHLSLIWGRPVSDPAKIPTLVDRQGLLNRSASALGVRAMLGRLSVDQVRIEFAGQVRKVLDAGLTPTHLDTHKHIHVLPGVADALVSVAGEFGIHKVRLPRERSPRSRGCRCPASGNVKRAIIALLSHRAETQLCALKSTDHFVGIADSACLDTERLSLILRNLDDGVTELMCHPGHVDDQMKRYVAHSTRREIELNALRDTEIRDYTESGSCRLMHFGDL